MTKRNFKRTSGIPGDETGIFERTSQTKKVKETTTERKAKWKVRTTTVKKNCKITELEYLAMV